MRGGSGVSDFKPVLASVPIRKPIGKRVRFEIFKRDGFRCQYCGAHPPAVILQVDHITPVAEGGTNDTDNLVTSCAPCNLGKGARLLSDAPQSLMEKAADIVEREEQIRGFQAVMEGKRARIESEVDRVIGVYEDAFDGWTLTPKSRSGIKHFVERLGVHSVLEAMEIAVGRQSVNKAFRYFCGICWNRIREAG